MIRYNEVMDWVLRFIVNFGIYTKDYIIEKGS